MDWASHWRGHVFLFEGRPAPAYTAAAGWRLLAIVLLLEALLGPRFHLLGWLGLPSPHPSIRVALLLVLVLSFTRFFAGVSWRELGLRPWREWNSTEKSYFVQVLAIANAIFAALYFTRVKASPAGHWLWLVLATNFLWGFYQELVYRGLLQTELVRRFGAITGILMANLAYTFGPLHFHHLSRGNPWPMMAAIFAIGLLFAVVYHRSRNLWLPAVFHGIGTAWILSAYHGPP